MNKPKGNKLQENKLWKDSVGGSAENAGQLFGNAIRLFF